MCDGAFMPGSHVGIPRSSRTVLLRRALSSGGVAHSISPAAAPAARLQLRVQRRPRPSLHVDVHPNHASRHTSVLHHRPPFQLFSRAPSIHPSIRPPHTSVPPLSWGSGCSDRSLPRADSHRRPPAFGPALGPPGDELRAPPPILTWFVWWRWLCGVCAKVCARGNKIQYSPHRPTAQGLGRWQCLQCDTCSWERSGVALA